MLFLQVYLYFYKYIPWTMLLVIYHSTIHEIDVRV